MSVWIIDFKVITAEYFKRGKRNAPLSNPVAHNSQNSPAWLTQPRRPKRVFFPVLPLVV